MKLTKLWPFALFVLLSLTSVAQKKTTKKPVTQKPAVSKPVETKKTDAAADEKKVREIVAFLEYILNTLGSSGTPSRDKDVLITESYSKIFRDSKVQVEDDLDEERKVITYKDVVAYLKDVNFFFHDVKFEFTIEAIASSTLPSGQHFYKVSTTRNLRGTTTDREPVNTTSPRYIEINYDPKDQDLKIVSIYTREFNEKEALQRWWTELSLEWQSVFRKKLNLSDSVQISDIRRITSIDALDISGNPYVLTLEPLMQFSKLQSLNLSHTQISDLSPIRNLTELTDLDISNTSVQSLTPLKYARQLRKLNISNTEINDISVLEKFPLLETVDMQATPVTDFTSIASLTGLKKANLEATAISSLAPFQDLTQLNELNVSRTAIEDLSPLANLKSLKVLNLDSTGVRSVSALSSAEMLSVLHINYTSVAELSPLQKLKHLEKIYCDQSLIKRKDAEEFMASHPGVLVILDSRDLKVWWEILPADWRTVFSKTAKISLTPSKEELAKLSLIDSINLTGYPAIDNLEPLNRLQNLKVLIAPRTKVHDLSPLENHKGMKYLDISETDVRSISPIRSHTHLKVLKADGSKIENGELISLPALEKFYADATTFNDVTARAFLERNPRCLLIYKTSRLTQWWHNLPAGWNAVFSEVVSAKPSKEELHWLAEQELLDVKDARVNSLSPLSEFVQLKELYLTGTGLTSLTPIRNIQSLKLLGITSSPIQKIDSLDILTQLEDLDISNTPIEDIYVLWKLKKLKKLNCAGTQLKRLDGLQKLEKLEYLDCSNTNVSKLDMLDYLPLKTLKCFNTKISNRVIENFKASHPDCTVMYYR